MQATTLNFAGRVGVAPAPAGLSSLDRGHVRQEGRRTADGRSAASRLVYYSKFRPPVQSCYANKLEMPDIDPSADDPWADTATRPGCCHALVSALALLVCLLLAGAVLLGICLLALALENGHP